MMINSEFIQTLFRESHANVKEATASFTHEEAVSRPFSDDESIHWIVGHLVVARCNFLTLLNVPSVWDWPTCKLFIPGSHPTPESAAQVRFEQILADFDQTQEQLLSALSQITPTDLGEMVEDKSLNQTLIEYAVHEAFHAGQLVVLRNVA